jgi:hypothetical protein
LWLLINSIITKIVTSLDIATMKPSKHLRFTRRHVYRTLDALIYLNCLRNYYDRHIITPFHIRKMCPDNALDESNT